MDTSTPLGDTSVANDLHRQALLKNTVGTTPLRRRSLIQTSVTVPVLEISNDENERANRRSFVEMQKRLSNIPQESSSFESNKSLAEQDMKAHLQICTKLFCENKITSKIAWKLQIIDFLKHIAKKPSSDTLQIASTSLDISAKVYGIRVDDVHANVLKLASNMARTVDKESLQNKANDEAVDDIDTEKKKVAAKKKKKKRRLLADEKHTISKDPKSLQGPLPKLESVFFSTRSKAETSAIDNLFTNLLRMDNCGFQFILLGNEKAWVDQPDPVIKDINRPDCKKYSLNVDPLPNIKLCVPFSDFEVDEWNPDEEEKQLAVEKSLLSQRQEVVFDNNGIPIPELDGSIQDIFENHPPEGDDEMADADDIESIHEEIAPQVRGEIARIVEFRPNTSEGFQKSEYSYNSYINTGTGKFIDKIWAGPSHWKLKFIRRSSVRFSGQASAEVKKNKYGRKKAQPQMFNVDAEYEDYDMKNKLTIKKKPPTVDVHKITLPIPDMSCIHLMKHINEFMSKPGVCPVQKKPDVDNQGDYEVNVYNYDNPNDSQYCSQQHGTDSADEDLNLFDDNHDNDVDQMLPSQNFLGDNLIDAPECVPKSYVPYALQSKKMDMKKLKTAVWQSLTNTTVDIPIDTHQKSGKVIPTMFSKLYKDLPHRLSEKMNKELSCPMAFVALLHLCNEQNLNLEQLPGYKDFNISGPSA